MDSTGRQGGLFDWAGDDGTIWINADCRIRVLDGYCVVTGRSGPLTPFAADDRMGRAYAMVSLVEQGWAKQTEVAFAFGCSDRTVRRNLRRFESGGLAALGRPVGFPKGRPRASTTRIKLLGDWKAEGVPNREIARRLGISEMAVRKMLRRLGWRSREPEQLALEFASETANPNLSGSGTDHPSLGAETREKAMDEAFPAANPKLSGSAIDRRHRSLDATRRG